METQTIWGGGFCSQTTPVLVIKRCCFAKDGKEIYKVTKTARAVQSLWRRANARTSAFCPLRWLIYVFNSVVNTKLPKIHISHQNVHFRWQNAQQSVNDGNRKTNKTNKVVEQAKRRVLWGNIEALVSCISKNVNCVIHFVKRTFNRARTFHHSLKSSWANESKDYYNVIHPFVRFLPSDIGNRLLQAAIVMSDWPSKDSSRFLIHMAPSGRVIMIY